MKLSDIQNFIQGNINLIKDERFNGLPQHIKEQAALRAQLCEECTRLGKCPHCGCSTPGMFYAPRKTCSKGRWGVMLGKDQWENRKINLETVAKIQTLLPETDSDTDELVQARKLLQELQDKLSKV
jgi:hypothetical protein